MNNIRLANVIFDKGKKITQTHFTSICESIESDMFTLDEYVISYKSKEKFLNKIPYVLQDGTRVLVSEECLNKINTLNIDRHKIQSFISKDYNQFKTVIGLINNGSN